MPTSTKRFLTPGIIFFAAFFPRLIIAGLQGETAFLANGYGQYLSLVERMAASGEYCLDTAFGTKCAFWPPLYPGFLFLFSGGGHSYYPVMVLQAALGSATALTAFYLADELFGRRVAVVAGLLTAFYPYYLLHDVQLQDTVLAGTTACLGVLLLVRIRTSTSFLQWVVTGAVLGAAVLTRATALPFVVLAVIWVAAGVNLRKAVVVAAVALLTVSPWLIRNYVVVGGVTLTSQTGRFLWIAHNDATFSYYPSGSIDASEKEAYSRLSPDEQQRIMFMGEMEQSAYLGRKGIDYAESSLSRTILESVEKTGVGFAPWLSPSADLRKELVYSLSYGPILILAIGGLVMSRRRWRELMPVYLLITAFVFSTAIFWAHTSHRAFLDVYLMIFAALAAVRIYGYLTPRPPLGQLPTDVHLPS
jgi:4-amino-4-deoxy-L-arabinose transferase-like glycosyltransferase